MKRFLIITALLFVAFSASAQLDYGLKAGVNFSTVPTDIDAVKGGHTGWFIGPTFKAIMPVIGLGGEANLLYSNTGMEIDGEVYNKHSIEIPLYLRYELKLPAIKRFFIPFVAAGPQWGLTVGKKEFGVNPNEIDDLNDIREAVASKGRYLKFNNSCWSLNIGLGFILFNHLQVHANYNWALGSTCQYTDYKNIDFKNFGSSETNDWITVLNSSSNIWQISLAYIF